MNKFLVSYTRYDGSQANAVITADTDKDAISALWTLDKHAKSLRGVEWQGRMSAA